MRFPLFIALLLLVPTPAIAHSPIAGVGSFYNGILHPFVIPAHLLLLIGLGALYSIQPPSSRKPVFCCFAIFTFLGFVLTFTNSASFIEPILVVSIIVGAIIVFDSKVSSSFRLFVFSLSGVLLGLDSSQDMLFVAEKWLFYLGNGISLCFILVNLMMIFSYAKKPWQKIGIRILGSWIITISSLGLLFNLISG